MPDSMPSVDGLHPSGTPINCSYWGPTRWVQNPFLDPPWTNGLHSSSSAFARPELWSCPATHFGDPMEGSAYLSIYRDSPAATTAYRFLSGVDMSVFTSVCETTGTDRDIDRDNSHCARLRAILQRRLRPRPPVPGRSPGNRAPISAPPRLQSLPSGPKRRSTFRSGPRQLRPLW